MERKNVEKQQQISKTAVALCVCEKNRKSRKTEVLDMSNAKTSR